MHTYGLLVSGLKLKHLTPLSATLTPVVDLLFKLLIAVSVTRLTDAPVLVIFMFTFAILLQLSFMLHYLPYEDKWKNVRLIFNGSTYLLLVYHLILFTDFVNYKTYPLIANSVIYLVCANIVINVILTDPNYLATFLNKLKLKNK